MLPKVTNGSNHNGLLRNWDNIPIQFLENGFIFVYPQYVPLHALFPRGGLLFSEVGRFSGVEVRIGVGSLIADLDNDGLGYIYYEWELPDILNQETIWN